MTEPCQGKVSGRDASRAPKAARCILCTRFPDPSRNLIMEPVASSWLMVIRRWRWSLSDRVEQSHPLALHAYLGLSTKKKVKRSFCCELRGASRPVNYTCLVPEPRPTGWPLLPEQPPAGPVTKALGRKHALQSDVDSSPDLPLGCATLGKWLYLSEPPLPSYAKRGSSSFYIALP